MSSSTVRKFPVIRKISYFLKIKSIIHLHAKVPSNWPIHITTSTGRAKNTHDEKNILLFHLSSVPKNFSWFCLVFCEFSTRRYILQYLCFRTTVTILTQTVPLDVCDSMHMHRYTQIGLHVQFIAYVEMFQQFFIIIFLMINFSNVQNQISIKCKHIACIFPGNGSLQLPTKFLTCSLSRH